MTNPTIDTVFDQLDRDRHLAGFPLEARAHPFFGLFLADAFRECLKIPIKSTIVPEFPYLKNDSNNQSPKVDFFALSSDHKNAFLIEVKTDMNSERTKQDKDLEKAAGRKMRDILCDLIYIAGNTGGKDVQQKRRKYYHLLKTLNCLKLVKLPDGLEDKVFSGDHAGIKDLVAKTEVNGGDCPPKIIYILPKPRDIAGSKIITFEEFARAIKGRGEIANRFALSLLEWAKVDAGSHPPGAKCP